MADATSTAQLLGIYMRESQDAGMSIQEVLGGEIVFPTYWPSFPVSDLRAERIVSRIQEPVPYLARVLRLPDFDRAEAIGTCSGHSETRTFGELLIDLEEDRATKAACGVS